MTTASTPPPARRSQQPARIASDQPVPSVVLVPACLVALALIIVTGVLLVF